MKVSEFSIQFNIGADLKSVDDDPFLLYFLVRSEVIVYVGKSNEFGFSGRLRSHKADKDYDSYFTMNGISNEAQALELEKGFISLIRPEYNKADKAVNIKAIRALIQYVTAASKVYTPKISIPQDSDLYKARGKVRSYRSRIAKFYADLNGSELTDHQKEVAARQKASYDKSVELVSQLERELGL